MSHHDYLEYFWQAIEKIENYGYTESKHTKEGVIIDASLPDVSDIMDEVVGFL